MFFAAVAALALTACVKTEITSVNEENQHAIGLSLYTPRPITKADGTFIDNTATAGLVVGKHFAVYANSTANGTAFTTSAIGNTFMSAVSVEFASAKNTSSTGMDTYSPLRYWPSGDTPDYLTFWAYYPLETGNGITYTAPTGSNDMGSYAFTAASTAATMVDFLVSDVVNDMVYTDGNKGIVPLVFHHQLTKVQFLFKTDATTAADANTKVYLTDAKLIDVLTTRTLNVTYSAGTTSTAWAGTNAATPANYEIFVNGKDVTDAAANKVELTATATTATNAETFLMVPQTMIASSGTNPQILRVNWDVVTDGVTTHNQKDLYLDECVTEAGGSTQANIDWVKNQRVIYTITIGPKPIKFTGNVEGWGTLQNGYFDVQ